MHGNVGFSNAWPIGGVVLIGVISILYNRKMWKQEESADNEKGE